MKEEHVALKALPLGSIRARGWIREQLQRSRDGMGGHLDELEPDMIATPYINGKTDDKWGGVKAGWGAEISGNYWYGLILLAFGLDDQGLKQKAERWVNGALKNQRPDGYLGTYTKDDNPFDDYNAWGTNCGLRALLAYHEATGRADVLEAVHRCLLWFCRMWPGDRKTRYAGYALVESMSAVYRLTGDEHLAAFISDYTAFLDKGDLYANSRRALLEPVLEYCSEHGAAYAGLPGYFARAYMANGDVLSLEAAENAVRKVTRKAMHVTGGIVCNSEYLSPISTTAETEYCAMSFFEHSLVALTEATGRAAYADLLERVVFNAAQGARKKDEKAIAYMSSPNQMRATDNSSTLQNDMEVYAPVYPVSCCPVTSVWAVPTYLRGMGFTGEGGCYIASYGPAELDFGGLTLEEDTEYPFREDIHLKVLSADGQTRRLNLRVPAWCRGARLAVNGAPQDAEAPRDWMTLERRWQAGDVIDIVFPMAVRVGQLDDGDSWSHFPLTIEYGPLVFALPIPEKWTPIPGHPRTPLPEGWHWWNVEPVLRNDPRGDQYEQQGLRKFNISWNTALDPAIAPEDIAVERRDEDGYVWEHPRLKLHLKGYKALFAYPPYPCKNLEVSMSPIDVYGGMDLELVPYGCTALRITYFTRARLPEKPMPWPGVLE